MSALAAVHLASDNSLGILNGDPALRIVDVNDEDDHRDRADEHQQCEPPLEISGGDVAHGGDEAGREAGNDACKQDHGDAVADAEFGDLLTEPHDQRGAGGEGQDDDYRRPDALSVCVEHIVVLDEHVVCEALKQADRNSGVTGDGSYLLSAFLAALLAQALQRRNRNAQELDDNGGVDVRLDGQSEDGRVRERAAAHNVEQAENGALLLGKVRIQQGDVDVRNRDGVAKTVKEDDDQREEYLLAQLFDLPCITQCLKHLDHLCLSAGRLDLLFRGFGESSSFDSQLLGNLAVAKELYAILALGDDACVEQCLRVYDCAVLELIENCNVDGGEGLCKDVVEASLRDAACQRHLAAFKTDAGAAAGASLLTLVATAGSLAVTGGMASALALVDMGGAGYGRKIIDIHSLALLILRLP